MGKKQKAQVSNTIEMDARKFLRSINDGVKARHNLHERLIGRMGKKAGKNWSLTALSPNYSKLIFEDLDEGRYYGASVKKTGSRVEISNIKPIIIKEEQKPQIFAEMVYGLVDAIAEGERKGAEVAFSKIAQSRFSPRLIPDSGRVLAKDGEVHNVTLGEGLIPQNTRQNMIKVIVESLTDKVVLEKGRVVKAVLNEDEGTKFVLPINETIRRREIANFMKQHATKAYLSESFQKKVRSWASLIGEEKIAEAVKASAQFFKEYQEFCMLTKAEMRILTENTLVSTGSFNSKLADDASLLMYKVNLKVNGADILQEWAKVAHKTENSIFMENVKRLKDSENIADVYDEFLGSVMSEDISTLETDVKAYQVALASVLKHIEADVGDDEMKMQTAEEIKGLLSRLADPNAVDHATLAEVRNLLADIDEAIISDLNTTLSSFDQMPGTPDIPPLEPGMEPEGDLGGMAGMGGMEADLEGGMEGGMEGDGMEADGMEGGVEGGLEGGLEGEAGLEDEAGLEGEAALEGEPEEEEEEESFDFGFEEEEEEEPELAFAESKKKGISIQEAYNSIRTSHEAYVAEHGLEKFIALTESFLTKAGSVVGDRTQMAAMRDGLQTLVDFHLDVELSEGSLCEDPYGCEDGDLAAIDSNYGDIEEGELPDALKKNQFKKKGEKKGEECDEEVEEGKMPAEVLAKFKGKKEGGEKSEKSDTCPDCGKANCTCSSGEEVEEDQYKSGTKLRRRSPRRQSLAKTESAKRDGQVLGEDDFNDIVAQIALEMGGYDGEELEEDQDVTDPANVKYNTKDAAAKDGAGKKRNPKPQVTQMKEGVDGEDDEIEEEGLDLGSTKSGGEFKEGAPGNREHQMDKPHGDGVTNKQSGGEVKEGPSGEPKMDSPHGDGVSDKSSGGEFKEGTPGSREHEMDEPHGDGVAEGTEIDQIARYLEEENDITDPTKAPYTNKEMASKDGSGKRRNPANTTKGEADGTGNAKAPSAGHGDMTNPDSASYTSEDPSKKDGDGKRRNKENTTDTKGGDGTDVGGKTM